MERDIQTGVCDEVSRQCYLASGSFGGWLGKKTLSPTLCVCKCVLKLRNFSVAALRQSGLRTITDITHDSHVTTQGHYSQNAGLMIAACTVEGE